MNATELFTKEGKSAGVFYCATCKRISQNQYLADVCCAPKLCEKCNEPRPDHYLLCDSCRHIADHARELERFNKAVKVQHSDWCGPVYADGYGYNEGYFASLDEMFDYLEEDDLPEYAYCCLVRPVVDVSVNDIIERILDNDVPENFELDDIKGTEELEKALTVFREVNKESVKWNPDYSRVVVIGNAEREEKR
jgi:hypothetical protein